MDSPPMNSLNGADGSAKEHRPIIHLCDNVIHLDGLLLSKFVHILLTMLK